MRFATHARRDFLRLGGTSAIGLGLLDLVAARRIAAAEPASANSNAPVTPSAKAKSCILIWLDGGPSHLELFDPKPEAPVEVRGPMASIGTSLPGIRLGECMERTAKILDQVAIVRSMTSPLGEHNFGTHYLMTGYKPSPALEYPAYGSVLATQKRTSGVLPPNIAIPAFTRNLSGQGFLPESTAPFSLGGDPERGNIRVPNLDFYPGQDLDRVSARREMVQGMDDFFRQSNGLPDPKNASDLERAYELVASADAKAAFDLSLEPDQVRNRYGRSGGNGVGQSCLLARRLVERGVPFVTVHSSGWDTHQNIETLKTRYKGDPNAHLPSLDRAFSALVGDLKDRGLLDETLVIVMGEFGRTPKINPAAGRDHWPNVFSVALAGGGVPGGQVVGSSDALAEFPKDRPTTPSDLATTIYTLLGINPASELRTSDGRPVRVGKDGARVIKELIG